MNKNDYTIRLERSEEHRDVENLVREAFWNVYRPGCSEHYVIHVLRDDPAFVKELDFVMEQNGRLIGQNVFMKTVIQADDGRVIPVLTMGPIGILPELKRQGYGKALLDYSLEKATELGFGSASGTTTCRKTRMPPSSSAKSWSPDTSTVSPGCIRRRRGTMWMTPMSTRSTRPSRRRRS